LQPIQCEDFDPRTWKECLWNKGFEGEGEIGMSAIYIHVLVILLKQGNMGNMRPAQKNTLSGGI
jgi:hypothetical protein